MSYDLLPAGSDLLAQWREAGEWWDGESASEWLRYIDPNGIRREESFSLGQYHYPSQCQSREVTVDYSEDWSLRTRKLRDGKMKHPFVSEPPRGYRLLDTSPCDVHYVPLHVASGYDFGRGVMLPEEVVQFAKMNGFPGICIADRFSLVGAVELDRACRESNIQPLIGASFELETGGEIVLIAQTKAGYINLSTLITKCHLDEERLFPVLRLDNLWNFSSDLICLTGGSHGPLLPWIIRRDLDAVRNWVDMFREHFGSNRLYFETDFAYQPWDLVHNQTLLELSKEYQLPIVAGGLVTHARPDHFPVQEVISCAHHLNLIHEFVGRKPKLHPSGFPVRSINRERYLRTSFEQLEMYSKHPELLTNSLELLEQCQSSVMPTRTELPKLFEARKAHFLKSLTLELTKNTP